MNPIIVIALLVIISGCAGSPARVAMMSDESLQSADERTLCHAYHFNKSDRVKNELIRRNLFSDSEWYLIDNEKIRLGISEKVLVCAWGGPTSVNETVSASGIRKQWVYRQYGYYSSSANYVYTKNGVVVSWQK